MRRRPAKVDEHADEGAVELGRLGGELEAPSGTRPHLTSRRAVVVHSSNYEPYYREGAHSEKLIVQL